MHTQFESRSIWVRSKNSAMKRKQPSPLVRGRYSAAPLASSGSSVQSSNSRKNHIDLQSASVVCPAVLAERKDTPSLRTTSRGSRVAASGAVATQVSRETGLADLHNDMNAQSALGSRASLLSSWVRFHQLWFGPEMHPFPLTTFKIYAVGAMLKAGGYRSAPNFLSRAKEEHVVLGFLGPTSFAWLLGKLPRVLLVVLDSLVSLNR